MLFTAAKRSIYTGSIGKVVATYAPLEPSLRPSLISKEGFNERFFRLKNFIRNSLSSMYIQKSIRDFSRPKFVKEAAETYAQFLSAFTKCDSSALRMLCTPNLYSEMSSRIKNVKKSEDSTNLNLKLLAPPRIIQILPVKIQTPAILEIFQITVEIKYNLDGREVKDYVVFERSASASDKKWKVCGNVYPNHNYYKL